MGTPNDAIGISNHVGRDDRRNAGAAADLCGGWAMIDYNDGQWHGWNGGECPVHPESVVEVAHKVSGFVSGENAEQFYWDSEKCCIVAFRVIRVHKEPREFWIVGREAYFDEELANKRASKMPFDIDVIHVRELLKGGEA